jgi:hypothetical protein
MEATITTLTAMPWPGSERRAALVEEDLRYITFEARGLADQMRRRHFDQLCGSG